ncbi:hypothetical protein VTL71DRAFT_1844 [Oculimacula yallundae]|uniref:Uncharacterized protein n=1 Tax=Oculimacula yallundae TaxID=86028 RepID=A0ABR4CBU9_9HELO
MGSTRSKLWQCGFLPGQVVSRILAALSKAYKHKRTSRWCHDGGHLPLRPPLGHHWADYEKAGNHLTIFIGQLSETSGSSLVPTIPVDTPDRSSALQRRDLHFCLASGICSGESIFRNFRKATSQAQMRNKTTILSQPEHKMVVLLVDEMPEARTTQQQSQLLVEGFKFISDFLTPHETSFRASAVAACILRPLIGVFVNGYPHILPKSVWSSNILGSHASAYGVLREDAVS